MAEACLLIITCGREAVPHCLSAHRRTSITAQNLTFITGHTDALFVNSKIAENNVIDNKKVVLKDELIRILPQTKDASIAVGYFFISGLSEIIDSLQDTEHIRFLISNTTDKETSEALLESFKNQAPVCKEIDKKNFVNKDRENLVCSDSIINIKKSLEYMPQTSDDRKVVTLLMEMIQNNKLEVRVYPKEKLHAKAYIFTPHDASFASGMGIVGSSNLSMAGLSENTELNLKTHNSADVNKLLEWFDDLWKDGLVFTDAFNVALTKSWAGQTYSPYELFLKALYHEFKDRIVPDHTPHPIWDSYGSSLYPFQRQAVDQSITMIDNYGGVIIGDVVGLGKTYIGTVLLKYLQLQDYRPLIICPPSLVDMWEEFCAEFEVDAKVISRGRLACKDYELFQDYKYKDRDLVLIDESHHFKNNTTRQYENLQEFMQIRDAKAILLTATPYSNNNEDIKNQIMLFHRSSKTSIPPANETDLDQYFSLVNTGQANLVDLLRNIMIRRTRRYILKQWGKEDDLDPHRRYLEIGNRRQYFPDRVMKTRRYDINKVYQNNYDYIVDKLDKHHLTLARYSPGLYLKDDYKDKLPYSELQTSGPSLVRLIRSLLLKRMESSLQAFRDSIGRYIQTHKIFLNLLEKDIIPVGDLAGKVIYDAADLETDLLDDPDELEKIVENIKQHNIRYKFTAFHTEQLSQHISNDLKIFEDIMDKIIHITHHTDDKLARLQILLNDHSDKKIIVFTEFASTAEYIYRHISWPNKDHVAIVTSDRGKALSVARRFDPIHNHTPKSDFATNEPINLLISTDVLSEGVNLQAGHVVINYDFHWNPVRLIQRVGRIDRIGSTNAFIEVHNFLPDPAIEKDLRLEKYVDLKINEIQRVIGEDYTVLKENEIINKEDMYAIYDCDQTILDNEGDNPLEPSRFEQILTDVYTKSPDLWEDLSNTPDGIRSSLNPNSTGKLLIACQSDSPTNKKIIKYYVIDSNKHIETIDSQNMLEHLESSDRSSCKLPNQYDELVSIGWNKFMYDLEQIDATVQSASKLTISQCAIIERLIKIARSSTAKNLKVIDSLRRGFSIPISKGKLNRELNKLRKLDLSDSEFVDMLSHLYRTFDLQKRSKQHYEQYNYPRILYTEYIGD